MSFLIQLIISTIVGVLLHFFYFAGRACKSKKRLDGKIAIITGANTGIGYETAKDFASRGALVIMACRDLKKAQEKANKIILETNNNNVSVEHLDLADLENVREFADKMNKTLTRLDLLINNAGISLCPYWKTKQGFEMQFGTNHLGHFLLTNLLLNLLKKTNQSRIVTVSSVMHNLGDINWDDINSEKTYSAVKAYGQSKLANILFTVELNKLLKDTSVTAYCLHPGSVNTEVLRYTGKGLSFLVPILMFLVYPFWLVIAKTPREGAQTTVHCGVADEAVEYSGCYFNDCKPETPSKHAQNKESAERLWKISEKMVGLKI